MKKLVYILFFLWNYFAVGQVEKINVVKTNFIAIDADTFIGFDGFNNCFYTKDNVLFKKVDSLSLQYQNLSLGKISKVDILNPLKIIVFYAEFNSVVILDNQLNEVQKISFSKLETPVLASAIGVSGQNKLWVYDTLNQYIGLFDLTTNQYQKIGIPITDGIGFYQTDFNYFQWIDKQYEWKTCTIYGRVFQSGKVEVNTDLQLLDENKILFSKDNILFLRDRNVNKLYEIEIVEKSFKKFYYKDQILSIFTDKGITNYKITIP